MFYHIICDENWAPLKLCHIGTSSDINRTRFGPGRRDLYIIHYVISGKGYFNGNSVSAGEGFLIKPNTYEHYYADKDDPWEFIWITSKDCAMENIFPLYGADPETQIFTHTSFFELKSVAEVLKKNHNKIYNSFEALELFVKIFNSHNIKAELSNEAKYFKIAENYISFNTHKQITVSEITNLLGVSQPYLYKVFKNKCNMSLKEYINYAKLAKAKELLVSSSLNISEISYSVGYSDPLSFSKFFKTNTKISPTEFRNSSRLSQ